MPDFNQLFANPSADGLDKPKIAEPPAKTEETPTGLYDPQSLKELWQQIKRETFENRWVFEKQWQRNIWYVLGRQWIEYLSRHGGWRDKRMAAWIPRPVTNVCKTTVQAIRAMFTSIKIGVNVRPNGSKPKNVSAAATADELAPALHEIHGMDGNLNEFDFWLIVLGNAFFHTFVDYDIKYGTISDPHDQCMGCGADHPMSELGGIQPTCPDCGGTEFQPMLDESGEQKVTTRIKGRPITIVLSPLELAFPNGYSKFEDLPYVVRMRWRPKRYFDSTPELAALKPRIVWAKAPIDHSMHIYSALSKQNDLGITPIYWSEGSNGGPAEEGIAEYEVNMRPSNEYPDGLVFRVYGDADPIIAELPEESIPGPLPYKDADGNPLFTFTHAAYEQVGGRLLGSGPLDVIIQKQDQLNQLDSMILLIIQRMANPVWKIPKGSEVNKLTGMPGLVIKYDALITGGQAKPEREPGIGPDASLFRIREQYIKDIEELAGTFDVIKGAKPTGVEAFSALQLLVERSQARFTSVFQARGNAYKDWFKFAIELEREFGPAERTLSILSDARTWTFKNFQRTQLQGSISVLVEDGTAAPKTTLGMRAAIDHASQLGMLNMGDPDQQYEGLKLFGLTRMVPALDIHVQAALQKQQAFEEWCANPEQVQEAIQSIAIEQQQYQEQLAAVDPNNLNAPVPQAPSILGATPLRWRPWYNPLIHKQEFLKWVNSDSGRELMARYPFIEPLLEAHLAEMDQQLVALIPQQPIQGEQQGAGRAMANSNQNSGSNGGAGQSKERRPGLTYE